MTRSAAGRCGPTRPTLEFSNVCCGPEARGVAVAYGKVFAALLDGSVVALDAKTGEVVWQTDPEATLPPEHFFYSFTLAPQVYDGMVIVGIVGRGISHPRLCPGL